jgi:phosphatidylserine/phosphatidylglycerophosphate/cardiolipin synthase-like enzyme
MGDLLHHKFGLVDGQTVLTGSHNWSAAADRLNDETLLVVKHPIVATLFQREFDRLWSNATTGITPKLKERLAADRARCGS